MFRHDRNLASLRYYDRTELLIMPKRNDAAIFMTRQLHSPTLRRYMKDKDLRVFTMILYACLICVQKHPVMLRFVMGQKVYDHKRWWVSTVIKKDKGDESSNRISKFELKAGMTPSEIQTMMDDLIHKTRTDHLHDSDRLMKGLSKMPGFLFTIGIKIAAWLDKIDALPNSIIDADPLHTGVLIANLGSIQGQSVYHHLFNWGTCSLIITLGALSDQGDLEITFTVDERIGEGVAFFKAIETFVAVLEDPYAFDQ